jgi:hypothetical protein
MVIPFFALMLVLTIVVIYFAANFKGKDRGNGSRFY